MCAIEKWDSLLNATLPNGCSPSWYMIEKGQLDYPMTIGEYMTKSHIGNDVGLRNLVTPPLKNVVYREKSELYGSQYLYLIPIFQVEYFHKNKDIGFSMFSAEMLKDIRDGKCKIVLIQDTEGMSGVASYVAKDDFIVLNDWCTKSNIPHESVYYMSANLKSRELAKDQGCQVNVIPVTVQEMWVNYFQFPATPIEYIPVDKKVYLNYSRRPRQHRVLLSSELIRHKLFDSGVNSFNTCDQVFPHWNFPVDDPELLEIGRALWNGGPIFIDRQTDTDDIAVYMRPLDYEQTFLSLVTETIFEPETLFMSEKTWKPISIGHPFVIIGSPGCLKYLHEQGFKTFDRWIDESYDSIIDVHERIKHVVNELKKFNAMSIDELSAIRIEMLEVLTHNKAVMKKRVTSKYFYGSEFSMRKPIEDELVKIWASFK